MTVYFQVGLLVVYLAALFDFFAISRTNSGLNRGQPGVRMVTPLAAFWVSVYIVMLIIGLLLSDASLKSFSMGQIVNGLFFIPLVVAGMHWKNRLGVPSLPWLWALRKRPAGGRIAGVARRTGVKKPIKLLTILYLTPVIISLILFTLVPPAMSEQAAETLKLGETPSLATILLVLNLLVAAPLVEEIIFRHYIQTRLIALFRRLLPRIQTNVPPLAIALGITVATILFAFSHTNILTNDWLKYAQIMVLGASLGWCQWRLGTEASVFLHYAFNFTLLLAAPFFNISA